MSVTAPFGYVLSFFPSKITGFTIASYAIHTQTRLPFVSASAKRVRKATSALAVVTSVRTTSNGQTFVKFRTCHFYQNVRIHSDFS